MSDEEIDASGTASSFEFLKLQKLRADKGIPKTTLASEAKVAVNTINSAEKRFGNKYETLMRIFNVLNDNYYSKTLDKDDYIKQKK